MQCESADDFDITIGWQHASKDLGRPEGHLSITEENSLRIRSVQLTDAGSYACTGHIGSMLVLKKYYSLVIHGKKHMFVKLVFIIDLHYKYRLFQVLAAYFC